GFQYVYLHDVLAVYMQAADENRVSRSKGAGPTLAWFEIDRHLLSSSARSYFYTRHYFLRHMRERPSDALRAVSRLALCDTRSFGFAMRGFVEVLRQRGGRMIAMLTGH